MSGADYDIIIAGGGVIGASIVWRLARNHLRIIALPAPLAPKPVPPQPGCSPLPPAIKSASKSVQRCGSDGATVKIAEGCLH
jgi:hypothetical protein